MDSHNRDHQMLGGRCAKTGSADRPRRILRQPPPPGLGDRIGFAVEMAAARLPVA